MIYKIVQGNSFKLHICFNEMEMPKMIEYKTRVMTRKVSVSAATII